MKVIKFTKTRYMMFILSAILIAGGLVVAFTKGPNWGTDFKAGLNMKISVYTYDSEANEAVIADVSLETARVWFDSMANAPELQSQGIGSFIIRATLDSEELTEEGTEGALITSSAERKKKDILNAITTATNAVIEYGSGVATESFLIQSQSGEFDGYLVKIDKSQGSVPTWTKKSFQQLILLLLVALLLTTLYIWFRFKWTFALAAMVALLHDILLMIGFVSIAPFEVSTTTIAAFLTIIGYSLNDTIVVFDRIRENQRLMSDAPIRTIINSSITQSLSRTLITSVTTFLAVFALFYFAKDEVKSFAANMMAGVVFGTYSSIFVASPVLLELMLMITSFDKKRRAKKYGSMSTGKSAAGDDSVVIVNEEGEVEIPLIERKMRRKKKK